MLVEEQIVEILLERGWKVSTAESCTGGMVASRIVNVPGVSNAFDEGYITYANEAKQKLLKVKKGTLDAFGAVSEETAREMAEGVADASGADCSLVTTGIAGPGGGTEEKPVGLVYIGCWVKGKVVIKKCLFDGDRMTIRCSATQAALELLLEQLKTEDK